MQLCHILKQRGQTRVWHNKRPLERGMGLGLGSEEFGEIRGRKGQHKSLGPCRKGETMHMTARHVHDKRSGGVLHRPVNG